MAVVLSCTVMVRVFRVVLGGGASFGHAVLGGSTFGGGGGGADMRRGKAWGKSVGERVSFQMRCDTEDGRGTI